MRELIGKLFGTEKALSGIVDGVSNGIDKLIYTDEEKATDAASERAEARKMVVQWMAASQGQKLARRLIALSITGVWLFQYLVAQGIGFAAIFIQDPKNFREAAEFMRAGAGEMNAAVMLILAFYFAAPHMGDIAKAALIKFGKKGVISEK
jgi:hypothetical protein